MINILIKWYFYLKDIYLIYLLNFVCTYVCAHACRCPHSLEEGIRSPGVGEISSCESPVVGAGNQTWVVHKSSKWSELLGHLSSPLGFKIIGYVEHISLHLCLILIIRMPSLRGVWSFARALHWAIFLLSWLMCTILGGTSTNVCSPQRWLGTNNRPK